MKKEIENFLKIFLKFPHLIINWSVSSFLLSGGINRGISISKNFNFSKKSRNGGLNSFHTSSSFDLFVLFSLSGGTDCGTPIPKGFDFSKKSRNGGFNSFHTSLSFDLFVLFPLSERINHWTLIKTFLNLRESSIENLIEIFVNHHQLICLLCYHLMKKQVAEHQFRKILIFQKKQSEFHLKFMIINNESVTPHVSFGRAGQIKNIYYWSRTHHFY